MSMTREKFVERLTQAAKVGVPILAINTADARSTMQNIVSALKEEEQKEGERPKLVWDCQTGLRGYDEAGVTALGGLRPKPTAEDDEFTSESETPSDPIQTGNAGLLNLIQSLGERSMVFVLNADFYFEKQYCQTYDQYVQGIWNLRDTFKQNQRMLILLAPDFTIPLALKDDILLLDDPLPTEVELGVICDKVHKDLVKLTPQHREKITDATIGLASFSAQQAIYMALRKDAKGKHLGADVEELRSIKRRIIEQTPGLKIRRDPWKFADIGGVQNIKSFFRSLIEGKNAPKLIVFIDEVEKALAGATSTVGDNTGVSQDILSELLKYMEDEECDGSIFVGPPGTSKSMVAKSFGNEADVDTIALDIGGLKTSALGETEHNIRTAIKVIHACSKGRSYWVATCNKLTSLPPELQRRFTDGIYFFDLPTEEERASIWPMYIKKYKLEKSQLKMPDDHNWTGSEIRNCAKIAFRRNCNLQQASLNISPVWKKSSKLIERLRLAADQTFISASYEGLYKIPVAKLGVGKG